MTDLYGPVILQQLREVNTMTTPVEPDPEVPEDENPDE